jgi:hypothetical protein
VAAFWHEVTNALREPIEAGLFSKNESTHVIVQAPLPGQKKNRARIKAKTAWNADTLRGDYADLLILDEFQLMSESAWQEVGAPMLMDNDGDAVFIYTPPSLRSSGVSKAHDKRYVPKLYKLHENDPTGRWATFHFSSHANPYISTEALSDIRSDMTALAYRQEIEAEDIDEVPGALWKRTQLDEDRIDVAPVCERIVVGVDPTCSEAGDEAGIVVCGKFNGTYVLLEDMSRHGTPDVWARAAIEAYRRWKADRIVYETNQGGQMVAHTLETVERDLPLRSVHASRGKMVRAEPIAALAEQHKIKHIGSPEKFGALEDELCSYTGVSSDKSPNRLDAYVYAMTDLKEHSPKMAYMR